MFESPFYGENSQWERRNGSAKPRNNVQITFIQNVPYISNQYFIMINNPTINTKLTVTKYPKQNFNSSLQLKNNCTCSFQLYGLIDFDHFDYFD